MWMKRISRWGTGCGIEIRGDDLQVLAVKSRPAGVTVLGRLVLAGFRERDPQEWGREYAGFLEKRGLSHLAATVSLPRSEVIVRQIQLPRLGRKELAAAVAYQLESLHPFGEDEVYHAFAPLDSNGGPAGQMRVSIVIAERGKVDAYAELFEQAGIAVRAFTANASAFYSGVRVRWDVPPIPFVIADRRQRRLEIYGEASNRPFFSAEFDLSTVPSERALHLAGADLRLGEGDAAALIVCGDTDGSEQGSRPPVSGGEPPSSFEERPVAEILPVPLGAPEEFDIRRDTATLAVGLEAACPRLGWQANLLPPERRKSDSRWMYAPTAGLLAALLLLATAFLARPAVQNRRYLEALEAEQARLAALANGVAKTRTESGDIRRKVELLRSLQARTEADLKILSELSERIPETVWLTSLDINDRGVQLYGEGQAEAAPSLLGILNGSRFLTNAAFSASLVKTDSGERFQIVAERRVVENPSPSSGAAASQPAAGPASVEPAGSATLSTLGAEEAASPGEGP